ncbi:MAG: ATP-binding protein [Nannocystaceae bacterium]|nr:ATP-binding protein [Nannocystaceae bacterium]
MSSRLDAVAEFDILDVARDWSFWDREIPESTPRAVELPDELTPSVCLVVQGVRRCGKSTLLQQLIGQYELDAAHCAFVNFEDPRLVNDLSFVTLQALVDGFRQRHPDALLTFFLDEIQIVQGWEKWLRSQLDRPAQNLFVVTGSNAFLLSGELSSTLTGRHLTVELYPFDLAEVRTKRRTSLESFLQRGGFPEPLSRKQGDALLRQYFIDIVERDVRERVGARSGVSVRRVVQMAFEAAGSELSLRRISGATGLAVETVAAYLEGAQNAYLLFSVPYFAYSERKRAARNKKYYPVDPGLRRVVVTRTGEDWRKALECVTHLKLRQRYGEVFYWRGKGEVDFVVRDGDRILPFQVTWDEPAERHHKALEAFYEVFPTAEECVFVTSGTFEELFG